MIRLRATALSLALILVASAYSQKSGSKPSAEIDHFAVHVRDLQRSAVFYEKVMGLEKIPDPFKDDRHVWFRMGPHSQLHVIGGAAEVGKQDQDVHLSFRVASLEEFKARLSGLKIKYVNAKGEDNKTTVRPDGVNQVYFQDPDGYWLEVNDNKY
jgi:lactoylglutathione lyase